MPPRRRILGSLLLAAVAVLVGCRHADSTRNAPPSDAELARFRDRVLAAAARELPGRELTATGDPRVLKHGNAELGLQNLFLVDRQNGGDDAALARLVREQLGASLAAADAAAAARALDWVAAKPLLRPQIAPAEYGTRMPLAQRPFAHGAIEAYVLDQDSTYQYVLVDDLARWKVTLDEVRARALENLDRASAGLSPEVADGAETVLVFSTHDGYDAARLLLPSVRAAAAAALGSPFHAAIPTRDTLVLWRADASPDVAAQTRRTVAEQFSHDPYALSDAILEVTATSLRELPR